MPNVTVAFDEGVKGWTSEFTFVPDSMLSLNNKFFSFKDAQMWVHNDDSIPRNNFYGIQGDTIMEFVFNDNPTLVKNYKTLSYEGVGEWPADIKTNLEDGSVTQWTLKEGKRFSWIQGSEEQQYENIDYKSNAVSGIGTVNTIANSVISFDHDLPSFIALGDVLYKVEPGSGNTFNGEPVLVGTVSDINRTENEITIGDQGVPSTAPTLQDPVVGDFILYVKDNRQEKSGIIGFYQVVTLTNSDTDKAEVFSVNTNSHINNI